MISMILNEAEQVSSNSDTLKKDGLKRKKRHFILICDTGENDCKQALQTFNHIIFANKMENSECYEVDIITRSENKEGSGKVLDLVETFIKESKKKDVLG